MSLLNYKSEVPKERLEAAQRTELTRQSLLRGEATADTLAYARFLSAVQNDATISHGSRKGFKPDDDKQLARDYPFLEPLLSVTPARG